MSSLFYQTHEYSYFIDLCQVVDFSRDVTYPVNVVMVFYIAEESNSILAGESKAIFNELTLPEITFYLQVVVKSTPIGK